MVICATESCDAEAKHRSLCGKHYRILLLQGERLVERVAKPAEERFWDKVNKSGPKPLHGSVPGLCWQWTAGKIPSGYGSFHVTRMRATSSHRYAWESLRGTIPDGLTIDHLCRNKACVNPDHMEVVTREENTLRAVDIGASNRSKTHCKHGHEFTPENTRVSVREGRTRRSCRACARRRDRNRSRRPPAEAALARQAAEAAEAYGADTRLH